MPKLSECINGLPNICGEENVVEKALAESRQTPVYFCESGLDFDHIKSAFAIALHMHQPLIPAGGPDFHTAEIISNLQYMMEHQDIGDNHDAPVFLWCYKRMGEFIPRLKAEGAEPRIMLDYSGTLLHGLIKMGAGDVIDSLRTITSDSRYCNCVEWLGSAWGHPVAPSTPVQDYRLHIKAWQHHFAAIFGIDALKRVRGFSPAEMALPNHPDVSYEFVKTLKNCGYRWVLVQEHTVEQPEDGKTPQMQHIPHLLVCKNSRGETESIVVVIKTQGSDTKLVGQMQPYYEAKGLGRVNLHGMEFPPLVTQISDGENGGVMMNEFTPKYFDVIRECSHSGTPMTNVSEYLEHFFRSGIKEDDLPRLQPLFQKQMWQRFSPGQGNEKLEQVIEDLKRESPGFTMAGGSWTNNLSWVHGYQDVLGPMEEVSALFYEKVIKAGASSHEYPYRNALFHIMCSQTSCFRYWGQGLWTEYGKELCRRAKKILTHDF